jgi:uncharacterized iron-regulated membrane protein
VKSKTYRLRRIHRWLGLFIGIQFVLWTIGGLYFSWIALEDVHGDHLLKPQPRMAATAAPVAPTTVLTSIATREPVDSLVSLDLASVAGRATYRISYITTKDGRTETRKVLADGATGEIRGPVTREEAIEIAKAGYSGNAPITGVEYLTPGDVGRHHEFREQPLPAWAVTFGDAEGATLYIPADVGQVLRVRNNRWRIFDFLWMLHTMDYQGRDDFNNLVLRAFSVLGLVTVASGFVLFGLTSRPYLNRARRRSQRDGAAADPSAGPAS